MSSILQATELSLSYGDRIVLDSIHLNITPGTRLAISGPNGSGKSSLFKVIAGIIPPDSGTITVQPEVGIGYLPQNDTLETDMSLMEYAESAFDRVRVLLEERESLASGLQQMETHDRKMEALLHRIHEIDEIIEHTGYYSRTGRVEFVLKGLGFTREDFSKPCREFSSGKQMRISLARLLLDYPEILLLDEPTNYLDLEARMWLLDFLRNYTGSVLLVSHDRYFLDQTVHQVGELFLGSLRIYQGTYTRYLEQREAFLTELRHAYQNQQQEIARLEAFIQRFRYNASKARLVQSRIKQLENIEPIEIPRSMKRVSLFFPPVTRSGRDVCRFQGVSKSYSDLPVLSDLDLLIERGVRMAAVGPNGAGKTTLLRIAAGRDQEFEGTLDIGAGVRIGYFNQSDLESLGQDATVIEDFESHAPPDLIPKARDILGSFLFHQEDVFKPCSVLSGGEKTRLVLLRLIVSGANFLILDEPTNHLDIDSKDALLRALREFTGTILFVSHDRYFIEELADSVLELSPPDSTGTASRIRIFPGDYHYYLSRLEAETLRLPETAARADLRKPGSPGPDNNPPHQKGQNQKQREERKKVKTELRRLERRESDIMNEIELLENRNTQLEQELSWEDVYSDGESVKKRKTELETNRRRIMELTEQWAELEEQKNACI
jgi:ATP-binding cassette, subfamily F, member 3